MSTCEEQLEWRMYESKVAERRLKLFGHVKRRPLEHACAQIIDMKPPAENQVDENPRTKVDGYCE